MKITSFRNGLTVRELKELIKDWPEENMYGEPCEVWMDVGSGMTCMVVEVCPLNYREQDGVVWSDVLFSVDESVWENK